MPKYSVTIDCSITKEVEAEDEESAVTEAEGAIKQSVSDPDNNYAFQDADVELLDGEEVSEDDLEDEDESEDEE